MFKKLNSCIIDYGIGNHKSLFNFLKKLNLNVIISNKKFEIKKSDIIFLPGVGSFPEAINNLIYYDLEDFIKKECREKLTIGICLGMQVFANYSVEIKKTKGLSIIPGKVNKLKKSHIGWNKIFFDDPKYEILNNYFYFNHNYYFDCNKKYCLARFKNYGTYPAIIKKDTFFGLQFHPEKSQNYGLELVKKIIEINA